jgi:hypothetical protein
MFEAGNPEGKGSFGRPSHRWEDVRKDLKINEI